MKPTTNQPQPVAAAPPPDASAPAALADGTPRAADRLLAICDQYRYALLLAIFLLYILSFNAQWRISTDSAEHVIAAAHLVEPDSFALHQEPSRIEPGLSWLLAAEFSLLGIGSFSITTALMFAMGLLGLASAFVWVRVHLDRPNAVLVTTLLAVNFCYYQYAYTIRPDLPFAVALLGFLAGYELFSKYDTRRIKILALVWMAAAIAIMTLFRSVAVLVLLALGLALTWRVVAGPDRLKPAVVIVLAIVSITIFRWADPRLDHPFQLNHSEIVFLQKLDNHRGELTRTIFHENLPRLTSSSIPDAAFAVEFRYVLGDPLSLLIIAFVFALWLRRPLWVLIPVVFVSAQLLPFDPLTRYLLPVVPIIALAWWLGARWLNRQLPEPWAGRVFVAMILLWIIPNGIQVTRHIIQQRSTPFIEHYKEGRYIALQQLGQAIADKVEPHAMILTDGRTGEISWYARRHINDSFRYRDPDAWRSRFNDTPLYFLGPPSDATREFIHELDLQLDEPIITIKDGRRPLTLHPTSPVDPERASVSDEP